MLFAVSARRRNSPLAALLCVFVAVAVLVVGALPSAWLWRCRHTGEIVSSRFAELPQTMPCGMRLAEDSVSAVSTSESRDATDKLCCRRTASDFSAVIAAPSKCAVAFVQALALPAAYTQGSDVTAPLPLIIDLAAAAPALASSVSIRFPVFGMDRPRPPPPFLLPHCSPTDLPGAPGRRGPPSFV